MLFLMTIPAAYAQTTIPVNQTQPCFMNMSAGPDLWRNCGADVDYLAFALLPFEWVTGGLFSMIFVAVIIGMVLIIYHKVLYATVIGLLFLPISFAFFPGTFLIWAVIMSVFGLLVVLYLVITKQTKEY